MAREEVAGSLGRQLVESGHRVAGLADLEVARPEPTSQAAALLPEARKQIVSANAEEDPEEGRTAMAVADSSGRSGSVSRLDTTSSLDTSRSTVTTTQAMVAGTVN